MAASTDAAPQSLRQGCSAGAGLHVGVRGGPRRCCSGEKEGREGRERGGGPAAKMRRVEPFFRQYTPITRGGWCYVDMWVL